MMLITNYITSAWRNILRHKLFSIINIMGLAIGLAAVMLIALYVRYETSYDSFWKNSGNIYRVHTIYHQPGLAPQNWATTSPLLKPALDKDFPQIEYSSRMIPQVSTLSYNDEYFQEGVSLVDPDFTKIFKFKLVAGELDGVLDNINNLVITQSMARKILKGKDPLGEIITINFMAYTRDYRVAAIIEDIPENTMMDVGIIVPFVMQEWEGTWVLSSGWLSFGGPTYFTLTQGVDVTQIREQMPEFIDRNYIAFKENKELETSDILKLNVLNIKDIHLKSGAEYERHSLGGQTNIVIFTVVTLLILLIAIINFMNLSTVRATQRSKEISLRKVVGASRKNLIIQFLGESIFLTLIALFIACSLVEIVTPFYNNFLGLKLDFNLFSVEYAWLLAVAVVVGLLGGLYPSFVLSAFHPARVLKANSSSASSSSVKTRSLLVILQFSISTCLFVATAVIFSQVNYIKTENLGFNQKNLLLIKAFSQKAVNEKAELLKSEIRRLPNVINVATSNFMPAPLSSEVRSMWKEKGETAEAIRINSSYVGYDYFETYGIKMLAGHPYIKGRDNGEWPKYEDISKGANNLIPLVVNEAALRQFSLGKPNEAIGKSIYQPGKVGGKSVYREFLIVGVIPNVKIQNMKKEVRPEIFFLNENRTDVFSVRFIGNPKAMIDKISKIWKQEVPSVVFDYELAEVRMINEYVKEQNELIMFAAFSGLAIFIACLGLFGLASFTAERRTKEIGIRKVFGAEVWQIVKLLVWQFSKPVLIANVIAWPIAYLAMSRWLESFVYRIDDMVIIALCLLAGLTALLIAWATVAGNSYAVARQNPIKALRYE